jgi:CheY-like chemotaxis protein
MFYKHQVDKELNLETNLPCVKGIYNHFSQIFMNIVQNALDAMHGSRQKKLTIGTWSDKECVYIDIIDTGTGIPDEIQESIFELFFSTKPNNAQRKGDEPVGTGLGLSSANYFIQQYGGRIEMQTRIGRGSKFTICLPVYREGAGTESKRILVIDDSASVLKVVMSACKKLGYETFGIQDSGGALDLFKKISPDLVITDLIMPKLTGSELMSRIREWNPEQRVIYLSGYLDNPDFNEWLSKEKSNAYTEVVSKPVAWEGLKKMILKFMNESPKNKLN